MPMVAGGGEIAGYRSCECILLRRYTSCLVLEMQDTSVCCGASTISCRLRKMLSFSVSLAFCVTVQSRWSGHTTLTGPNHQGICSIVSLLYSDKKTPSRRVNQGASLATISRNRLQPPACPCGSA